MRPAKGANKKVNIMKTKTQEVRYEGVGFLGMLTLLFIALKLTGYISWSWFWVVSPLFLPLALFFTIVTSGICITALCYYVNKLFNKFK